jgi:hypothetical protein
MCCCYCIMYHMRQGVRIRHQQLARKRSWIPPSLSNSLIIYDPRVFYLSKSFSSTRKRGTWLLTALHSQIPFVFLVVLRVPPSKINSQGVPLLLFLSYFFREREGHIRLYWSVYSSHALGGCVSEVQPRPNPF